MIAWQPTKDSKKYHYQISENVQFEKIIKEQLLEDVEVLSPELTKGEYFVRVRGELNDEAFSDWSEVHSLKMDFHLDEKPAAPRLVKNKIEFTPPPVDQRKPSSDFAPTLAWEKPVGISDFKVQIGKTKDFNQAKVYTVSGDQLILKEYSPGKTYFRVFSISSRGLASLPSEVGMVSVSYLDPKINPLKDIIVNGTDKMLPAPSTEMSVSWTPVPSAQKYLLEMDESDTFKNSKKYEVNGSSVPVILEKPGTFHVRVVALNKEGQIISRRSPSEKFQYIYRVPLSLPLPLEPFDKTTVFMQQDTEAFVWLEWKSVNDVKVYQLDLSTSPTFDTITLSTQTKEPRFLIKSKLPSGKIYWRVRALSESIELSSDWTKPREFSILFKRNETFR